MLLALVLGCPAKPALTERTACDPLDEGQCLFPFPSSHHLAEDPSTETGYRVAFEQGSFLTRRDGTELDPASWNTRDGFSINSTLIFYFAGGVADGLNAWDDIGAYAADDARTVIVDLTTGERVAHYADHDQTALNEEQRAYTLHPAEPLKYDHEYAVGVRGLVKADGSPVEPSEAFTKLRDGEVTNEGDLAYRVDHYEQVLFPALDAVGFAREDLQLAWSFRTISRQSSLGEMLHIRDEGLATVGPTPQVTVVSMTEDDCTTGGNIGRTVELEVVAPLYTTADGPGNLLNRNGDGVPTSTGQTTFGITARIPCSVLEGGQPAPMLQYGHGLLGSRGEVRTGWLSGFANSYGWIPVATEWTGMSENDVAPIVNMAASDPSRFELVPDRSMQGLLQQLLVVPAMRAIKDDPAFLVEGVSVLSPDGPGYYGNSQGGIMGASLMALSQDLNRGVLGVTGVNYGLTLPRSHDFDLYFLLIRDGFADGRDITLLVQGLFQQLWDASEGAGYLRAMNEDPLPNTPAKQILLHTAIGDNQVTTIGGQIQARAYGAKLIAPAYRDVYGVEEVAAGFTGSALVEWHYSDAAEEPIINLPPDGPDPHECPRREPTGMDQIDVFLRTGVVQAPCGGEVCSSTIAEVCP